MVKDDILEIRYMAYSSLLLKKSQMVVELIRRQVIYSNSKFKYFDRFLNHLLKQSLWFWKYGC